MALLWAVAVNGDVHTVRVHTTNTEVGTTRSLQQLCKPGRPGPACMHFDCLNNPFDEGPRFTFHSHTQCNGNWDYCLGCNTPGKYTFWCCGDRPEADEWPAVIENTPCFGQDDYTIGCNPQG